MITATESDALVVRGQATRRRENADSGFWQCMRIFLFISLAVALMILFVKAMEISKAHHKQQIHQTHHSHHSNYSHANHTYKNSSHGNISQSSSTFAPTNNSAMNLLQLSAPKPHIGCESTILIVRHCEKEGPLVEDDHGGQHCNYVGRERSLHLATLFGTRWPTPSKLYSLSPTRSDHDNYRELETLDPTSKKINLPIETAWKSDRLAEKLFSVMWNSCGKLTVIAWKHSEIKELATALGCTTCPDYYPEDNFDQVWQLKYVFLPQTTLYPDTYKQRRKLPKEAPKSKTGAKGASKGEKQPKSKKCGSKKKKGVKGGVKSKKGEVDCNHDSPSDETPYASPVSSPTSNSVPAPLHIPVVLLPMVTPGTASTPTLTNLPTAEPTPSPTNEPLGALPTPVMTVIKPTLTPTNDPTVAPTAESTHSPQTRHHFTHTHTTTSIPAAAVVVSPAFHAGPEPTNPPTINVIGENGDVTEQEETLFPKDNSKETNGSWVVFSTVTDQRFDPLEFSFHSGSYQDGGVENANMWSWERGEYVVHASDHDGI